WYSIETAGDVVEFQGTARRTISYPNPDGFFTAVSASVDPNTGSGEVFAIYRDPRTIPTGQLEPCESLGTWYSLEPASGFACLSATRDGHVYAALGVTGLSSYDVHYLDSSGKVADLGVPKVGGLLPGYSSLAASVGWFGGNEVFAVGK